MQTASGKTHTLLGTSQDPGIIILSVHGIFDRISVSTAKEFLVRVSYIEIYNEQIKDLLEPDITKVAALGCSTMLYVDYSFYSS
jgi:centromeric protein E